MSRDALAAAEELWLGQADAEREKEEQERDNDPRWRNYCSIKTREALQAAEELWLGEEDAEVGLIFGVCINSVGWFLLV